MEGIPTHYKIQHRAVAQRCFIGLVSDFTSLSTYAC